MTGRFEQNARQAYVTFIADTERTVIVAIRAAFDQMSTYTVDDTRGPRAESTALDPPPPRRAPTPAFRHALVRVAAAEAGDPTAGHREDQAWIADPLARGSSPSLLLPRRPRRDTRPDSPRALRVAPAADADGRSRAPLPAPTGAANEDGA